MRLSTVAFRDDEAKELVPDNQARDRLLAATSAARANDACHPEVLITWPRLWQQLKRALTRQRISRQVDMADIVERMSRGLPLTRLRRKFRRVLPDRIRVVVDRSKRLTPFWHDQDRVLERMQRLFGARKVETIWSVTGSVPEALLPADASTQQASWQPNEAAVVLGDLGLFEKNDSVSMAWRRASCELTRHGVACFGVVPAPRWRWPRNGFGRWQALPWEDEGQVPTLPPFEEVSSRTTRLLVLLAPATRIEPGLLRALRRLLPPTFADVATEADVWNHQLVRGGMVSGIALEARFREHALVAFGRDHTLPRSKAIDVIRKWHSRTPELVAEEVITAAWYTSHDVDPRRREPVVAPAVLASAIEHCSWIGDAAFATGDSDPDLRGLKDFFRRFSDRSQGAWRIDSTMQQKLQRADIAARQKERRALVAGGTKVSDFPTPPRDAIPTRWRLVQVGANLVTGGTRTHPVASDADLFAEVEANDARFVMLGAGNRAEQRRLEPEKNDPYSLPSVARVLLTTDTAQYRFLREPKPAWAAAMGRDCYGLYVVVELANIWQKMRWIPPGRFVMGSPVSERYRTDDESQHLVTLSEGFWLAETVCPRNLWEAVVGDAAGWYLERNNPDYRSNSPVRSVTFNDCQLFLERAELKYPGLKLRLPTEAEWEYACRAGTTTAFSHGDVVDPTKVNYFRSQGSTPPPPASTSSKEITHPMSRGPQSSYPLPVKSLPPNPWGLYEMHGNVWEWCQDWFGAYPDGKVRDPKGPHFGTMRVLRGGSHDDRPDMARSARRGWYFPNQQLGNFAFRFARGP